MSVESSDRQHPALPTSVALTPDADWAAPQALPETRTTPAPLMTAAGITLLALGMVWPSAVAGGLGALLLLIGIVLWLGAGLSSWRRWLREHPEEGS